MLAGLTSLRDEAVLVQLAENRGDGDAKVQEGSCLRRRGEQPVERFAARILQHQYGPSGVAQRGPAVAPLMPP